jgi:hypothetical protein
MTGPANDRGETLLEVLIAVVIIGVAIVAIIGGLVTSVLMSDVHRKQATAGSAVRDTPKPSKIMWRQGITSRARRPRAMPSARSGSPHQPASLRP